MNLKIVAGTYSICKIEPSSSVPDWVYRSRFYSISKSVDELSLVCEEEFVPRDIRAERDWGLIMVQGPLDFSLTGILSSLAKPLAENDISLFAISTFDTDYILVKLERLLDAKAVLEKSGFNFS